MTDRSAVERVSRALMLAGVALALIGSGVWMADALPPMPEWMLRLAVYKLTIGSGLGLLIAGAVARRSLRASSAGGNEPGHALGEGVPDLRSDVAHAAQPIDQRRETR